MRTSTKPIKRKVHVLETKLGNRNALGLWESTNNKSAHISIDPRLKGFQRLLIITHEAMHEACPEWTEERVITASEILAGIIWQCDYRHVDHRGEDKPNYKLPVAKDKLKVTKTYEKKSKIVKVRNSRSNS